MIEAVIFDFDGTLADTSDFVLNSFQFVFKKFQGKEQNSEYIRSFFGEPLRVSIEREFNEPFELVFNEYKNYQSNNFDNDVRLFDNAIKILEYLKQKGIKLAMVTSRTKDSVTNALKKLEIYKYFEVVVSVDDTKNHKPHREPLDKAMQMLNVNSENTLYVGDSRFDMECANNAGTKAALIGWRSGVIELKNKYNIDYILNNLYDISEII